MLLLTSREQPQAIGRFVGQAAVVRVLHLGGLDDQAGQVLLQTQGLTVTPQEANHLVQHYSGNPLALASLLYRASSGYGSSESIVPSASVSSFFGNERKMSSERREPCRITP